jgi:hypothetical protein
METQTSPSPRLRRSLFLTRITTAAKSRSTEEGAERVKRSERKGIEKGKRREETKDLIAEKSACPSTLRIISPMLYLRIRTTGA